MYFIMQPPSHLYISINLIFSLPPSFDYSGRHDNGLLPTLKTEGSLGLLITAVLKAKAECDSYLTSIIDEEYRNMGSVKAPGNTDGNVGDEDGGGGNADDDDDDASDTGGEKELDSKKAKM
jgi:hypothetical protein